MHGCGGFLVGLLIRNRGRGGRRNGLFGIVVVVLVYKRVFVQCDLLSQVERRRALWIGKMHTKIKPGE